jgi:hypothetical protein
MRLGQIFLVRRGTLPGFKEFFGFGNTQNFAENRGVLSFNFGQSGKQGLPILVIGDLSGPPIKGAVTHLELQRPLEIFTAFLGQLANRNRQVIGGQNDMLGMGSAERTMARPVRTKTGVTADTTAINVHK